MTTTEANDKDCADEIAGFASFIAVEQAGHSVKHYEESRHVYAQNIDTQQVWDFSRVSKS